MNKTVCSVNYRQISLLIGRCIQVACFQFNSSRSFLGESNLVLSKSCLIPLSPRRKPSFNGIHFSCLYRNDENKAKYSENLQLSMLNKTATNKGIKPVH